MASTTLDKPRNAAYDAQNARRLAQRASGAGLDKLPLEVGRDGIPVIAVKGSPFDSLKVRFGLGGSEVTVNTLSGGVGTLPDYLARDIAATVKAAREGAVNDARANFDATVTVDSLKEKINDLFADKEKLNRFGRNRDGEGFAEVPGKSHPGAREYVNARRNPSGSGSIIEGFIAGVGFSILPGYNPTTGKQDLVLKAERFIDVGASFEKKLFGTDALAVYAAIKGLYRTHPKINLELELPK